MSRQEEAPVITSIDKNGIQKIIFNRPRKKNAFTKQMYLELVRLINESAKNDAVYVLVITGNGDFYNSGNDFISYITDEDTSPNETQPILNFIDALINYPKLLIAIVNGPAIGIGATTLAIFDIVYASETAYFQTPFCKLGLSAEGCSSYTFPRIMGPSKAGEMLFFGEKLTAHEAVKVGFVSKVYEPSKVHEIWTHIEQVTTLSKESMAATKRLLSRWNKELLMRVNREEFEELSKIYASPTFAENMMKMMNALTSKSKL